jgi:hypothetical protein
MIVVAGPPGSGKTRYFPVTAFGVDAFNIDDRCAQILGSYRAIPRDVRRAVAKECERFVRDHIERGESQMGRRDELRALQTYGRVVGRSSRPVLTCEEAYVFLLASEGAVQTRGAALTT